MTQYQWVLCPICGDTVKDRVTAVVMKLHTPNNEFVDGIEKEDIHVTLDPGAYEEMRVSSILKEFPSKW